MLSAGGLSIVTRVPLGSLSSFFLVVRPRPLPFVAVVDVVLFERERGLVAVVDEEAGVVVDCLAMREAAAVALEMPRAGSFAVVAVVVVAVDVAVALVMLAVLAFPLLGLVVPLPLSTILTEAV